MQFIRRETLPDGSLRISVDRCSYTFIRPQPGVLLVTASGQEYGDLGRAALGEVAAEAALHPPARLFIDLSGLSHVATKVSDDWTAWFRTNTHAVRRVDVLTGSLLVQLTVTVSQLFARIGDQMRIHKDAASFAEAVREVLPDFRGSAG